MSWKEHHSKTPVLDFRALYQPSNPPLEFKSLIQPNTDNALTYAACYVHVDADRKDLALRIGADDRARVTINGRRVSQVEYVHNGYLIDQHEVKPISLKKGSNLVVFQVVNTGGAWQGCLHFVDINGRAAEGLRFGLEPE
jgi:hypothetical protein